jgi:flagellar biosynthetic protein FlhB
MADQSQRTEKPTQKRLQKARREGKFPTSREFVAALQFLATVMILASWGEEWFSDFQQALGQMILRAFKADFSQGDLFWIASTAVRYVFGPVLIAGGVVMAATLLLQFAVTRFGFSMHRLAPDWNRLNPINRLKELPKQNLSAAVYAAIVLTLCGLALWRIAAKQAEILFLLPLTPLDSGYRQVFASVGDLLWKAAGVFVAVGCYDLVRQRFRYQSQMRMSRQELREEFKEVEGNPRTKARIRRLQRNILRRKMLRQVPQATAVVVNPTHYAVALKYNLDSPSAPVVVAKGKNFLALRIRALATRHDVPLVENPPLARALYDAVPVNSEIPVHLYRAVAEILAYVYRTMRA